VRTRGHVRAFLRRARLAAPAAAALLACLLALPDAAPSAAPAPYVINAIMPLTGGGAFLGQPESQALEIVERLTNAKGGIQGRPIHFAFHDDQTSPQVGVQLAGQILAGKVPLIVGSSLVAICAAMAPLMKDGPVEYCLSPGIHPAEGSYVFTASVSTRDLAAALIRYFKGKGWTRIAVLTSTDATGQDAEQNVNAIVALPQYQGVVQVVAREHFDPHDVSVAAQIARISAAKPQALIAWSTGAPIGTVFKGIAQNGLSIPVATTNGNQTYGQMKQYASFLPPDLYFPTSAWPAYEALPAGRVKIAQKIFYDAFQAANQKPDLGASLAWDPALLVVDALRHLGTEATAAQIRDYLLHLRGFAGINGIYDFKTSPQRGLNLDDAIVTRWDPARQAWGPVSRFGGEPVK
jgi:branched-chain amino acid transport system substrate-binding protein